jgi:NADPH:quinone reductase-like Zn-dependent oxidoreductase/ketosteroid isomerase-like protein
MQALIATDHAPGRVTLTSVEEPDPYPDEAVVQVAAFSINRGETFLLQRPRPDWRPGKDVAGVVVHAAADGSGPSLGTRVVGHADQAGWAERVAVSTSRLSRLPDAVSFATAAALPLAGLTALRLLRVAGPLASRKVLLTGASGGVGHYFVELAAAHGALVTAVSASAERGARLRELGAADVVADVAEAAAPFEIAIESVGGLVTTAAWHSLEPHGLLIWLGQASEAPPQFDYFDWDGAMSVTIRKFDYLDSTYTEATDLATLVRLVAGGRLHPEIGLLDDWSRADESIDALLARAVRGNVVLTIGDPAGTRPTLDGSAVVGRYIAALNAGDERAIVDSFAEDAVWRLDGELPISGTWNGRDEILGGFFATARTFFDPGSSRIEVTRSLADGDHVVVEWVSRARTRDGAPYENHCAAVFTVHDGKIHAAREYMDTHYAYEQLLARTMDAAVQG